MKNLLILFLLKSVFLFTIACTKQFEPASPDQKFKLNFNNILLKTQDSVTLHLNFAPNTISGTRVSWSANIGRIQGTGNDVKYYAPNTQGLTVIVAKITDENNNTYSDTARIQVYTQLVLLKADDVVFDNVNTISPRWSFFIEYIKSKNIKASLGLIGNSLEKGNESYYSYLKSLANSGYFELWNHGYTHILNGIDSNGNSFEEFLHTSFDYQVEHLLKTQDLALQKLNITLHTFGAPGNAIDTTTLKALNKVGEIKVWYFGLEDSDKYVLKRSVEIEYPTGNPDFNKFQINYTPLKPYLVLQIHPNNWDDKKFFEFKKVIDFLIQRGVTFINPYDYYQLAH